MALHLDFNSPHTSSLTADEPLYSAGQEILINVNSKELKKTPLSKGVNRTGTLWRTLSLGCLAVFLALQVIAFVCSRFQVQKKAESKASGRRLAAGKNEDGSDPLRSYSPDPELVCWAAQEWQPVDTPAGYLRLSPQEVNAFFESISSFSEGHPSSALPMPPVGPIDESDGDLAVPGSLPSHPQQIQAYQPYPQQRLSPDTVEQYFASVGAPAEFISAHGPPVDSDDSNNSDEQRLSREFFKLKQHPQRTTAGPSSAAPGPAPSVFSVPSSTGMIFVAAPPSQAPGALSLAGLSPPPAAASAVQQQEPSASSSNVHPYIHVPFLKPGVVPRQWNTVMVRGAMQYCRSNFPVLYAIHDILLKASLDAEDVEQLMGAAEMLANFVFHRYRKSTNYRSSAELMRARGTRFILFETLYSTCQALGQGIPSWWSAVADAALQNLTVPIEHPGRPPSASLRLSIRLTDALRKYKKGEAPSQEEVLALKRALFVDKEGPAFFRHGCWQRWIKDDQNFTSGQGS